MRVKHVALVVSALVVGVALQAANFANNLATCVTVKDINQCLRETLDELRKLMPIGIPELNLRRSEPFEIDNLEFNSEPGIVDVKAKFSNVVVRGLSSFVTNYINADIDTRTLSLSLSVPRMDIVGRYNLNGKVVIFNVNGNGDFTTVLEGVSGTGQAKIVPAAGPNGGAQHLTVTNTDLDFTIGKATVRMQNLFNGELPLLAKQVNEWISQNSDLVINAVKPQIRRETITIVERVINDAFSKVPAQDFIENLERSARGGRKNNFFSQ